MVFTYVMPISILYYLFASSSLLSLSLLLHFTASSSRSLQSVWLPLQLGLRPTRFYTKILALNIFHHFTTFDPIGFRNRIFKLKINKQSNFCLYILISLLWFPHSCQVFFFYCPNLSRLFGLLDKSPVAIYSCPLSAVCYGIQPLFTSVTPVRRLYLHTHHRRYLYTYCI